MLFRINQHCLYSRLYDDRKTPHHQATTEEINKCETATPGGHTLRWITKYGVWNFTNVAIVDGGFCDFGAAVMRWDAELRV